jgi:uncharacterized glyoxalase superfamily protein PhnB
MTRLWGAVVVLGMLGIPAWAGVSGVVGAPETDTAIGPTLANVCLISTDVRRLAGFYETVLQVKAEWSGPDYAELRTGSSVLAIFSFAAQQKYIPDATEAAKNRSVILEFRVADADREYQRLQGLVTQWVKSPTTQPWGTRSIYFRDPDGNLVDFFVPAKAR